MEPQAKTERLSLHSRPGNVLMSTCTATSKDNPEHPDTEAGTTIGYWEYQLWVDLGGASLTDGKCGGLSKKCGMTGDARTGIVCHSAILGTAEFMDSTGSGET